MTIDVLFLLFMVMAIFRGLKQGLIIAVFSAVAIVIGLAAAIRLSTAVASWGSANTHLSSRWLPVLAFVLVFLGVVIVVRLGARLAEKAVDLALLSWINKLAGVILYAAVYI